MVQPLQHRVMVALRVSTSPPPTPSASRREVPRAPSALALLGLIAGVVLGLSANNIASAGLSAKNTASAGLSAKNTASAGLSVETPADPALSSEKAAGSGIPWPTEGWLEATPEEVGFKPGGLEAAENYAFTRTGNDEDRVGIRTDALLVVRHGKLVFERYARGYDRERPHLSWSMAKSVVNALYGIAALEGKVRLDDPALKYHPALREAGHLALTVDDLLRMSSGLYWNEGYEATPFDSSVLAMLYTTGRADMATYTAKQKEVYAPGTHWMYSSGTSNLLMGMFRNIVGNAAYADYPWEKLFDVLGMQGVTLERDGSGTFVGSSYLYARPRDYAKFGFLYLQDGVWAGHRILPQGWVAYSRTLAPAFATTTDNPDLKTHRAGAHWWLNVPLPALGLGRPYPDAPEDLFMASGHWGQFIMVIPSLDMVVVRLGDDRDGAFSRNELLRLIIAGLA